MSSPSEERMKEVCAAMSPEDLETLDMLELFWPGSYEFLVRLTANICDDSHPKDTVARMLRAVSGAMVVYRGTHDWSDRARWRAFADAVFANLGEDIERRKFLAACTPFQRDIVQNEDMSLYYAA